MSYHGYPPPEYDKIGIAVVNPLIRIEKKLQKVQEVLDSIGEDSALTAADLKIKIQKVIDDDEDR